MAGKKIEAGLRITADTAQAGKAVDDLAKKTTGVAAGVDKAGAGAVGATEKATKAVTKGADEAAAKLRQTQQQMRQLAPQFTDIFTSLQGGQSPFQVLIQQGGQIKDVFGGVGPALSAVASTITVARVAIGGVVGVVGSLAVAAFQANRDQTELNKTFALTGNIAGINAEMLTKQAQAIASSQNVSMGAARETLSLLVAQGNLSSGALLATGRAATALGKLTGQNAAEAVKAFDSQADGITQWSIKANRAYNFLSASQVEYIRSLESQGRVSEAVTLANDALAGALQQRMAPTVSNLGRLWDSLTASIGNAWDKLKKNLRDQTPAERLAEITEKIQNLERGTTANAFGDATLAKLKTEADQLRAVVNGDLLRQANAADRQREQNDLILRQSKQYKDAEANLALAANQQSLASQTAFLDKRRSEIERANDAGLLSAKAFALALNKVDQDRLAAQAAALKQQIAIEQGRVVENPVDVLGRDTRVKGLQGQLTALQAQIAQAASKGQGIVAAAALDDARTDAAEWAGIWQRAAKQTQTFVDQLAAARARLEADPAKRAEAEAAVAVAETKRQVEELKAALTLRIEMPGITGTMRAELQQQLDALNASAAKAIEESARAARLRSLQGSADRFAGQLQLDEAAVRAAQEAGQITSAEAERRILELRRQQLPVLERIVALLAAAAATPEEAQSVEKIKAEIAQQRALQTELERTARSSATAGVSNGLKEIVTGAKNAKGALLDMVGSFASAMLDVLSRRLAEQLVRQFETAIPGGGGFGGVLGSIGSFFAGIFHQGGVVGAGGASRAVPAAAFALAPRYHSGGIAGLMPGEVPSVLRVGEEVLRRDDPRHVLNGGGGVSVNASVSIDASGGNAGSAAGQEAGIKASFEAALGDWASRESRPGGRLWKLRNS